MTKPLGIILAGGLARRMGGGDKGMIKLGGQSLLDRVITRISPQVDALALNANGDASRFESLGLTVLKDSIGGYVGPLAGILAGLDWAHKQGAEHIVSVAADTPFFPETLVSRLLDASKAEGKPIALAASHDPERGIVRQPVFGLWPVSLREDLRDALNGGLRKIVMWADIHGAASAVFEPETCKTATSRIDPFFNINTPQDIATAEGLVERYQR
ncbi:MAG: molybdenum cofactor guanylyltransferase MobA [Amylibacter sp.]|nr:molybdenum cofactor guanylyltransferase MobA [Amylibacter sp.]